MYDCVLEKESEGQGRSPREKRGSRGRGTGEGEARWMGVCLRLSMHSRMPEVNEERR